MPEQSTCQMVASVGDGEREAVRTNRHVAFGLLEAPMSAWDLKKSGSLEQIADLLFIYLFIFSC